MLAALNQAYIYKDLMHYVLPWSCHTFVWSSVLLNFVRLKFLHQPLRLTTDTDSGAAFIITT